MARSGVEGERQGERSLGAAAEARPSFPQPRVLIVDDEPMVCTTLQVLLADSHEVTIANSGRQAQQILRDDAGFDLILCDLMMPSVSGMDLHAWLTANAPALAQRMVFMTGGVFTDDARDFLDTVANPRIDKPFDAADLLDLLTQHLSETAEST